MSGRPGAALRWRLQPARLLLGLQCLGGLAAASIAVRQGSGSTQAIAIGLATPVLAHGTVLAGGFLGSWWLSARAGPVGRWAGTFLREWPRSMWMVYVLLAWREHFRLPDVPCSASRAPSGPRPAEPAAPSDRGPVLLLHGFACHRGVWAVAARGFVASGRRVEALTLHPADGSIDAAVETVRAAVVRLRTDAAAAGEAPRPVHLIGHSMGGLVARAYLRRHGWRDVGAVVTLATPHRGTWQARYGFGEASRQMRRDSPWLRALADSEPRVPSRRMLVVASRQDNIVSWPAIQTVPGARRLLVDGLGHMGFLFEPRVTALALRFLDAAERANRPASAARGRPLELRRDDD